MDQQPDILTSGPEDPASELKSRRRKLIERVTLAGLGISVLIHLAIMLLAALITIDFGFADAGGSASDGVDFAVITQTQLAQTASPELEFESFEVAVEANEIVVEMDMLSDSSSDQSVAELADSIAPSLDPGGGSLTSIDATTGSAGAGTGEGASFFGLEAQGRRFAYIVDVSGSMNAMTNRGESTRWELTRAELLRSINGLEDHAEFYVVMYSGNPLPLFGIAQWVRAQETNKRLAASGLGSIIPTGGTKPIPAFEQVFALDPPPDAIYFMTDGLVEHDVPQLVRQMNRRSDVPIHSILFGDLGSQDDARAAKEIMGTIANQSGGKFMHIREGTP